MNRMRDSRLVIFALIVVDLFFLSLFPDDTIAHEGIELIGFCMVIICAFGRVYTTAFLGGFKNDQLITIGPYSMCRNPLYFFSLVGITGIGLLTTHLLATLFCSIAFLFIYRELIRREEAHLRSQFGTQFDAYADKTPVLWPSLRNYDCPDTLTFKPHFLRKAVFDSVWWFVPIPFFEAIEYLQEIGWIHPFPYVFW